MTALILGQATAHTRLASLVSAAAARLGLGNDSHAKQAPAQQAARAFRMAAESDRTPRLCTVPHSSRSGSRDRSIGHAVRIGRGAPRPQRREVRQGSGAGGGRRGGGGGLRRSPPRSRRTRLPPAHRARAAASGARLAAEQAGPEAGVAVYKPASPDCGPSPTLLPPALWPAGKSVSAASKPATKQRMPCEAP
eukprot:SM000077S21550  [mRNA]  locus=s77:124758:126960:- [translate_table: standard]